VVYFKMLRLELDACISPSRYLSHYVQAWGETEALGMRKTRDGDVLRLLVFFQHFELDQNNGRPRGRAFLNVLRDFYPEAPGEEPHSPSPLVFP